MGKQLDELIETALNLESESIYFDELQSKRVLKNIHKEINRRSFKMMGKFKKTIVAATAIFTIGTVTAIGANNVITSYVSHHSINDITYKTVEQIKEAKKELGTIPKVLQSFSNDVNFKAGYMITVEGWDENNNIVESFPELNINYEDNININIIKMKAEYDDNTSTPLLTTAINNITLSAYEDKYLFLPPNETPSLEDVALQEEGKLYISYGTNSEERKTYSYVIWNEDGLRYSLSTFDQNYSIETLIDMAKEVITQ